MLGSNNGDGWILNGDASVMRWNVESEVLGGYPYSDICDGDVLLLVYQGRISRIISCWATSIKYGRIGERC